MPDMSVKKYKMPELEPDKRNKTFDEVTLGYESETAIKEAQRCLNCKHKPCVSGCPVSIDIPGFIDCIKKGEFEKAYEVIRKDSSLPAVCGRVCPQETQCEAKCVRAIKGESVAIGRLERFVADYALANSKKPEKIKSNNIKAAVVGSGPAGLACAGELAKYGYEVTVFEALHEAGGVLTYGIPQFRLPKEIVKHEIDNLKAMGVKLITNAIVGKTFTIDELFEDGFKAVFIGSGAGLPRFMNIPGENLKGVYSANEYLTRINIMKAYSPESDTPVMRCESVAVVGGGNVAMDAARCAKRLGAENVYIIYRRSEKEMPARLEEIEHAKEEGIIFKFLTNPVEILGGENGFAEKIKCVKMELGEPDETGRRGTREIPGSEHTIDVQCVIMAIGTSPNPLIKDTTAGLETDRRGCIVSDDSGKTSRAGVFAGGDAVTGAATVILAMGAGKAAAKAMDEYIKSL